MEWNGRGEMEMMDKRKAMDEMSSHVDLICCTSGRQVKCKIALQYFCKK
jgi:hypothetical protein